MQSVSKNDAAKKIKDKYAATKGALKSYLRLVKESEAAIGCEKCIETGKLFGAVQLSHCLKNAEFSQQLKAKIEALFSSHKDCYASRRWPVLRHANLLMRCHVDMCRLEARGFAILQNENDVFFNLVGKDQTKKMREEGTLRIACQHGPSLQMFPFAYKETPRRKPVSVVVHERYLEKMHRKKKAPQ